MTRIDIDISQAIELRARGLSYQQIAGKLNCSANTIYRMLCPEIAEKHRLAQAEWRKGRPVYNRLSISGIRLGINWRAGFMVRVFVQGGLCKLCGRPETAKGSGGEVKKLSLDHYHDCQRCSGKGCQLCVRWYLCQLCNLVIGYMEVNTDIPRAPEIQEYLDEAESYRVQGLQLPSWQRAYEALSRRSVKHEQTSHSH